MKTLTILLVISAVSFCGACGNSEDNKGEAAPKEIELAEKKCMDNVMEQDSVLGATRNHASERISLSETITNYVAAMDTISFEHCLEDFSKAFKAHRDAWVAMKEVTDSYPELRGEIHDLFTIIEKGEDSLKYKNHLKPIWDTWDEVEVAMND